MRSVPLPVLRITSVALAAVLATAVPPAAAWAASPAPATSTGRAARGAGDARRGGAMPDSVLAVVGTRREVTLAAFQEAWRQVAPPARPDSLTPQGARGFLELLTGKEALGEMALREPARWTAEDSARYEGLRDQLTLKAVLDSALADTRARMEASGDTTSSVQVLGTAARDSAVARMAPRWDEGALGAALAAFRALPHPARDSSLMVNVRRLGTAPRVAAADSARALAIGAEGPFRIADLFESWGRLNPLERPRIDSLEQVRDLARNGLFERRLRADARARRLEARPDIAAALARQREYIAVQHLVAREVYGHIARDDSTLRRWYDAHRATWALPLRVRVMRLVLGSRDSATELALRLRVPADADSLAARALRRGARYQEDLTAARDSALFARALAAGAGTVLGPDSTAEGWQVVRVETVLPATTRSFEQARPLVEKHWYDHEGERLMQALLERARRAVPARVNERALARLAGR